MKKGNRVLAAILGGALAVGGLAPTANAGNEKSNIQEMTRHADKQVTPRIEQQRKRTPLGNILKPTGKPWFKVVPQKQKKHTNRLKCSHAAKVKRRKNKSR